jgi:hypothetical protein
MTKQKASIIALEALISLALAVAVVFTVRIISSHAQQSNFFDKNGSYAGSSVDHGRTTTFTDRNGRFDGTSIRNNDGTTSLYDRNGHFTGSVQRQGTPSNPFGRK